MPRGSVWIVGLASVLTLGCLHAPVLWSPDGRWLAYTMVVPPNSRIPAPGWLYDTEPPAGSGLMARGPVPTRPVASAYRLWATNAETGESVLLEESRGPLTSPGWSPDGKALAFGRLVPESSGQARFEIVAQDGPGQQRVLLSRPQTVLDARAADLPGLAPAWSPDGRYLAVPLFQTTLSLAIIRADNGRVLKVIEDAYWPSWSPDRTMLAFVHGGEPESLQCLDTNFGPPRHLAEIGQTCQPPAWSHDSRSIVVVSGVSAPPPPGRAPSPLPNLKAVAIPPAGAAMSPQARLIRVQVASGKMETIASIAPDHADRDRAFNGASFSIDRDGENLYFTSDIDGQPSVIVWFRPRTGETRDRLDPIDYSLRIGALAVSPQGRTLAFRVGSPGYLSTPALFDPTTRAVTPIVPDDSSRIEWVTTLTRAARTLLSGSLPVAVVGERPVERATLLPIPGEFDANRNETQVRLRRIGRIGRPICDRPADAPPADPALSTFLDEAKFFFDYLREDYAAALNDLDAVESRADTTDHRLRLLSVRAQVFLGLGEIDRAGRTIAYLKKTAPTDQNRLEMTPAGSSIVAEPGPGEDWPNYLAERASHLANASKNRAAGGEDALGHRNPDAPELPIMGPAGVMPFAPRVEAPMPDLPFLEVIPEIPIRAGGNQPPRPQGRARFRPPILPRIHRLVPPAPPRVVPPGQ